MNAHAGTTALLRGRLKRQARNRLMNLMCGQSVPSKEKVAPLYEWHGAPHQALVIDARWPDRVREVFARDNALTQDAYVCRIRGFSVLEGRSGFAASGLRVLRNSLPYDYDARLPSPLFPIRSILASRPGAVEHALSLRDPYELNYFHFFNDVVGKFLLAREHLRGQEIHTLIVSRALADQPWFRPIQQLPLFGGMQWRIQESGEDLVCRDLIVAKSPPHHMPYYDRLAAEAHARVAGRRGAYGERLLLIRRSAVRNQRIPANQAALQERLESIGFHTLDPAALPWDEQVLALRDCSMLVGIHGAGMTNLMFRGRQPLDVVEIFPPTRIPPHYYWLATLHGHRYTPVVAPEDFVVNLDAVVDAVETCSQ